jgi:hypothetical protein
MDPREIVCPTRLGELSKWLSNPNMGIPNGMADFYDDISLGFQDWDHQFRPLFIDFESA